MVAVLNSLIEIDEMGIAWIAGANTKVVEVVLDKKGYGWGAEEIHRQHPHLSLAQIHAALSYYYEHETELESDIQRQQQLADELRTQQTGQFTRSELEARLHNRNKQET